jgi:glycosyltransferase involved in cell wall biosynthesis
MKVLLFVIDPPPQPPGRNGAGTHEAASCQIREIELLGFKVVVLSRAFLAELPKGADPYRHIARYLDGLKIDYVHIVTQSFVGFCARRYCAEQRIPYSVFYGTMYAEWLESQCGVPASRVYHYIRWFLNGADRVIVPAASLGERLRKYGVRSPISVIAHGVDSNTFRPPDRLGTPGQFDVVGPNGVDRVGTSGQFDVGDSGTANVFDVLGPHGIVPTLPRPWYIMVGRRTKEKGVDVFGTLHLSGTLIFVGDGTIPIERHRQQYPRVTFTGPLSGDTLIRLYQMSDCFVFSSHIESFGLVVLEALACGLPVAALPVTGPMDILAGHPEVGVLDNDLASAALRALNLSRADCRAYAETFTWAKAAAAFMEVQVPVTRSGPRRGFGAWWQRHVNLSMRLLTRLIHLHEWWLFNR